MVANSLIQFHIGKAIMLLRLDSDANKRPANDLTSFINIIHIVATGPESVAMIPLHFHVTFWS
tara:strand:+ start:378 stop:566 length:189 start_codon:yes stop_codon:yes gene_type:complete